MKTPVKTRTMTYDEWDEKVANAKPWNEEIPGGRTLGDTISIFNIMTVGIIIIVVLVTIFMVVVM